MLFRDNQSTSVIGYSLDYILGTFKYLFHSPALLFPILYLNIHLDFPIYLLLYLLLIKFSL